MQEIIEMDVICELYGVKLIDDETAYIVEWTEAGRQVRQIYYCYEEAQNNFLRRLEEVEVQ